MPPPGPDCSPSRPSSERESTRREIQIAHAGDSNDLEYLRAIADQGATLGCDRFGIAHFNPDERRIETLIALVAEGYADQIILSHDGAAFYDFFTGDAKFAGETPSYLLVSETILPALREAGVTQEQIDAMLIGAPRRFLVARMTGGLVRSTLRRTQRSDTSVRSLPPGVSSI